jgi:hypothetical protein
MRNRQRSHHTLEKGNMPTPNPPRDDLPVMTYSRATGGDGLFYCFAVNE